MRQVDSPDYVLLRSISSGFLSYPCRFLPEVSPLPAEVREDREACAALCRLPSAAAGADQPVTGALRPQVQEGKEELHLQVRSSVFFFPGLPQIRTFPFPPWRALKSFSPHPAPHSPPCLCCADLVFTYFPCLSFAHLANCFLCASLQTGLSTFIGTTGNATCFPSTASATVPRGSPVSISPCTRKKVNASF